MAKSLVFGLLLVGICCSVNGSTREIMEIANLADVILKSTFYMDNNPAICFQDYIPKMKYLTDQYEVSLNKCQNLSAQAEEELKQQVQEDIDTIQNATKGICLHFEKCSSVVQSLHALFECYSDVAGNTIQSAQEVQNLSNDKMKFVLISEQNISYKQSLCKDECSNAYADETRRARLDLEDCLDGKPPRTTTVQPGTTTIQETTKVPETTSEPEDTTTNTPETA